MDKARRWLDKNLRYTFEDESLLRLALTHRSASGPNNERLEFLGDAVLDFVISDALFALYPDADEGDLSRLRASLVCDASLGGIAEELGIGEHLILGTGERRSGGHHRESILADAVEAIFGAVYLDSGFRTARQLIERVFARRLENLPPVDELRDPKTRLQEWLQARKEALPDYELQDVSGKAHRQRFTVRCSARAGSVRASGEGTSRRNAEQQAAERVLEQLKADAAS